MNTVRFLDVVNELEHLLHIPVRLTETENGGVKGYTLVIGNWKITDDQPSYYVKRKLAQLILNGWTGWVIHHDHEVCSQLHGGKHNNRRSFLEDYASDGQLYGLAIQRAELSPLACALTPIPGELNKLLVSSIMKTTILGADMTSMNDIGTPINRDMFEQLCLIEAPVSITHLGLDFGTARGLWEDAVERIELAHALFPDLESLEEILN